MRIRPNQSLIFRTAGFVFVAVAISLICISDALAQRGRGGGGRGGGGGMSRGGGGGMSRGGGGMSRPSSSMNRSPSMSRPSMPSQSRPSGGMSASRPQQRPAGGAAARPQPGGGVAARPQPGGGAGRPAAGGQRPGPGAAGGARPSQGELSNFLNLPGQSGGQAGAGVANRASGAVGNRPAGANSAVADFFQNQGAGQNRTGGSGAGNRAENIADRTEGRSDRRDQRGEQRDFASDNRGDRVSDRGDRQAARVSDRGEMRSDLASGRSDRRSERQQELGDRADQIRDEIKNEFDENHLFEDFWYDHPHAYAHFHQNPVFWTWATFNTMAAFMPWNWGSAAYYDYGTGGNVVYDEGMVTCNGETIPADEYAAQAEELATSTPEVENPDNLEWLPLGVFALTQEKSAGAPNMFLQLAVSKEGIIAGTYQNKSTDQTESVEGMVDSKSQRAAWTITGKNTPIMETGIANLTENETRALVHFADGTTQEWLMLHIENPKASAATPPANPQGPPQ